MAKKALFLLWFLCIPGFLQAAGNIPEPQNLGLVILNNYSQRAGLASVVFDHWLHRSLFTCRLCHMDVGFAMEAGETRVRADLNIQGFYCGACHDGKKSIEGNTIFAACAEQFSEEEGKRCARCHSLGKLEARKITFNTYSERLPRTAGHSIDWEKAEEDGTIKPVDFLEGLSVKRDALKVQEDFSIESQASWASDVIFSHKKHASWNGCALCHPGIYASTKAGTVKYSMFQIYEGESCGVCHGKVAFSLFLCEKCHTKPVR
ncbi:c(7)-type cytochrome triheme domain-containing protein [Thiovibrio sp. JS02]